jgi:hypothetical protein
MIISQKKLGESNLDLKDSLLEIPRWHPWELIGLHRGTVASGRVMAAGVPLSHDTHVLAWFESERVVMDFWHDFQVSSNRTVVKHAWGKRFCETCGMMGQVREKGRFFGTLDSLAARLRAIYNTRSYSSSFNCQSLIPVMMAVLSGGRHF